MRNNHVQRENILNRIALRAQERVTELRSSGEANKIVQRAMQIAESEPRREPPFEQALRSPGMSFICECKKASPSKGLIAPDFDPVTIARDYEAAGAAAISCLTEPHWFEGSDDYLLAIAQEVSIPVLRKDFLVDDLMIYQAKCIGAHAVLLICSILDDDQLSRLIGIAHSLGLSALVEAYHPSEVPRALAAGARVVGVNNRDLRTFEVDFGRSIDLRPLVGPERLFVSESGVETRDDVARLEDAGVDAVLIGEQLMRATNKRVELEKLRGAR